MHFELAVLWLIECPAGFPQQKVDEGVAGGGFLVIVGIGPFVGRGANGGDFAPQARNLGFLGRVVGQQFGKLLILVVKVLLKRLQLGQGLLGDGRCAGQALGIKGQSSAGRGKACVAARKPIRHVEELLHHGERTPKQRSTGILVQASLDA